MKISFPRHLLYLTLFSIFMIVFAIWFATEKLIPLGREYKKERLTLKKEKIDLQRYQDFYDNTLSIYNQTKRKNRNIIEAFETPFDAQKFQKKYTKYFIELHLSKVVPDKKEKWYEIYEVNTTSKLKSPSGFYRFLDSLNKSDWIVGVTFPIRFVREGELIHSSFRMHIYKKNDEKNTTKSSESMQHKALKENSSS